MVDSCKAELFFPESKEGCYSSSSLSPKSSSISLDVSLGLYGFLDNDARCRLREMDVEHVELKKNNKIVPVSNGLSDIYLVKEGWVCLCHPESEKGEEVFNFFIPGNIVGVRESFFINHGFSVMALTNCKLQKIPTLQFRFYYDNDKDIRDAITHYVMVNDNISLDRLRSCTHHKAEQRVAHFLLEVFTRLKFNKILTGNIFSFPLRQDQVGELIGMTNVHVSRCMTSLEQKKLIRKARCRINLLNPERLTEYTGFDRDFIYGYCSGGFERAWQASPY